MRPARPFPRGASQQLANALKQAKSKSEFQRVQCLWLRASLGLAADEVATAIGWQPTSVRRLQAQYLKEGKQVLPAVGRGGRRNQNLTVEQERQLLAEFQARAENAAMLEVSQMRRAYEDAVGHPVPKEHRVPDAGPARLAQDCSAPPSSGSEPAAATGLPSSTRASGLLAVETA